MNLDEILNANAEDEVARDEILNMPAGREMDTLIGEAFWNEPEIFWGICDKEGTAFYDVRDNKSVAEKQLLESPWLLEHGAKILPIKKFKPYSTDISAAWEVIERFENRCVLKNVRGVWECYLSGERGDAHTPALAICRSALLARRNENKK
jgi:hypothetical protein